MKSKVIKLLNKKISNTYLILFLIIFLAFILRIWNLTILPVYIDEYNHLLAIKDLIEKGFTEYNRAYSLSLIGKLFTQNINILNINEFIFWSRLPGVIFGSLSILPIYFLGKKIKKEIGFISAFLWAISPWAIGVSRNLREYHLYCFIILIVLVLTVNLFDLIKKHKKENNLRIISTLALLSFFSFYSYSIDNLSTLKVGIAILLISSIHFLLFNLNLKKINSFTQNKKIKKKPIFLALLFLVSTAIIILKIFLKNPHFSILHINSNFQYLNLFFSSSSRVLNWWRDIPGYLIPGFFIIIGGIWAFLNKNKHYFLHLFIFLGLLVFYTLFFDRYFRPRYSFYLLPFYSILIASGLYALTEPIIKQKGKQGSQKKLFYSILIVAMILFSFNFKNTIKAPFLEDGAPSRLTNEWHDNMSGLISYLEENYQKKDTTIISSPGYYINMLRVRFNIPEEKIYQLINSQDQLSLKEVDRIIEKESEGIIILKKENDQELIAKYKNYPLFSKNKKIEMIIKEKENIFIYKWSEIQDL